MAKSIIWAIFPIVKYFVRPDETGNMSVHAREKRITNCVNDANAVNTGTPLPFPSTTAAKTREAGWKSDRTARTRSPYEWGQTIEPVNDASYQGHLTFMSALSP